MDFDREQLKDFYNKAQNYVDAHELPKCASNNLERYLEIEEYARGGVKAIIKTKDLMTKREVAKAVMHKEHSEEEKERFLREAVINSVLEHPNIMPVYDIGFDNENEPFFIMKFVGGYDLGQILKGLIKRNPYFVEKYPLNTLLSIFIKICDAVAYAHSKGIIHRDLKPANIKVGEFGEVLVCDWGLGKFLSKEAHDETIDFAGIDFDLFTDGVTIDTMLKGTPGYMSPEQIVGNAEDVDMKSDIYALGAILFSILTFKRPFAGQPLKKVLEHTVQGYLATPSLVTPYNLIPSSLEAVVIKAMTVAPELRYDSVEHLKEEVNNYLNGFATNAEQANFATQAKLFFQRYRRACLTAITATITLISVVTYFIIELRINEQTAVRALAMYEQEKELSQSIEEKYSSEKNKFLETVEKYTRIKEGGKDIIQNFIKNAQQLRSSFQVEKATKLVDKALKFDPENKDTVKLKAPLSISLCQFDDILDLMDSKQLDKDDPLAKLAIKYILLPLNENQRLKRADDVIALAKDLEKLNHPQAVQDLLSQEFYTTRKLDSYRRILKCWLEHDNPQAKDIQVTIHKNKHGLSLSLAHNKLLKNIRALRTINRVEHLDFSETSISWLGPLVSMPFLKSLNISETKVPDLQCIRKMPKLKRLVFTEGMFKSIWTKTLPKRIKLEIVPEQQSTKKK